jgi:hypothetical protein
VNQPVVRASLQDWEQHFADIAEAAKGTAMHYKSTRDDHGERSALVRAEVYAAAGKLLEASPAWTIEEAAAALRDHGMQYRSISGPPLLDFEAAADKHVRARAWQYCAMCLDPEMEEFEKFWD